MTTIPPCTSDPALFASTHRADHMQARAICGTCPMLGDCMKRLANELHRGDPEGTWAGVLVHGKRTTRYESLATVTPGTPTCAECGQPRSNKGVRGMCASCYKRAWTNAQRGDGSRVVTHAERRARRDEGERLVAAGESLAEAARLVGMSQRALKRALERKRAAAAEVCPSGRHVEREAS